MLFEKNNVFSQSELESRYEVFLEGYQRRISIEGGIALEIARSMILPAVVSEYTKALPAVQAAEKSPKAPGSQALAEYASKLGTGMDRLTANADALEKALQGTPEGIILAMKELREVVDSLEKVVADCAWPLPKYREMLFIY